MESSWTIPSAGLIHRTHTFLHGKDKDKEAGGVQGCGETREARGRRPAVSCVGACVGADAALQWPHSPPLKRPATEKHPILSPQTRAKTLRGAPE